MSGESVPYLTLTDQNFQEAVLHNTKPVLVDFWAPWCGPCRTMNPLVSDLATELEGTITVGKVNVDEQPHIAAQYHIRSIPTFLIFQGGAVVGTLTGAVPKDVLLTKLGGIHKAA